MPPHRPPRHKGDRATPLTWVHEAYFAMSEWFNATTPLAIPGFQLINQPLDRRWLELNFLHPAERARIPKKNPADHDFVRWFEQEYAPLTTAAIQNLLSLTCNTHVTRLNEHVDRLAGAAAKDPDQPSTVSWAFARAAVTVFAAASWQRMMKDQTYRGHLNLIKQAEHRLIVPSSRHHLLSKFGDSPHKYAHLTRFISGHWLSGEFRAKFNRNGSQKCLCNGAAETRAHTLYECPYWVHPKSLPLPPARRIELEEAGKQLQLQAEEQHLQKPIL
ncbi:hypothetical protein PsYK624_153850 [Phanerochaete sordida]|uniref:Uncharacterized protein n=1 Tax=Phanerochaete sordida TaxID=48140 RepID=A0A9P3GNR0_9APHY|nr:hypothetical protein PsYK624_153850 [Phanerochaete sordida]